MSIAMLIGLSIAWGALVVCVAAGLQRLGMTGRLRQGMWRMAGALMLAPFIAAVVFAVLGPEVVEPVWTWGEGGAPDVPMIIDPAALSRVAAAPVATVQSSSIDWSPAVILSLLISLGWFARAILARRAAMELSSMTRTSEPVQSRAVLKAADDWAQQLGLARTPELRLMTGDFSPFTQGVRRPVVYLPHGLEARLSSHEMSLVIGHELMHVKRGDAVWRPVERGIADLLWFNPFAWFVRNELERARELACDEAMIAHKAPARLYAKALVSVARFAAGLPTQAPAAAMFPFNKDKVLPERVKAAAASRARSSSAAVAGLALFALGGLPLAIAQGAGGPKQRMPIPDFAQTVVLLEGAKVSSTYGERRHPISGEMKHHNGIDIAAPIGTPIHAPADGTVKHVDRNDGHGLYVKMSFNDEWLGRFSNLSQTPLKSGDKVSAGDVIGFVGLTAKNVTGPHLHMEIWGPGADFDRTGKLTSYDPEKLGLAAIPARELNAAQIRKLGIVLEPSTPPNPPMPPYAKEPKKVVRVGPGTTVGVEGDDDTVKIVEADGEVVVTVEKLGEGDKVVKKIIRRDADTGKVLTEKVIAGDVEDTLVVVIDGETFTGDEARRILKEKGELAEIEGLEQEFGEMDLDEFAWIESDKAELAGDETVVDAFTFVDDDGHTTTRIISRSGGELDAAELEELRARAQEMAEKARERAEEMRERADEAREESELKREKAHRKVEKKLRIRREELDGAEDARFEDEMEQLGREIEAAIEAADIEGSIENALAGLADITLSATSIGLDAAALALSEIDLNDIEIDAETLSAEQLSEMKEALSDIDADIAKAEQCLAKALKDDHKEDIFEARIELSALKAARVGVSAALRSQEVLQQ